jgi:hypothetical protein
MSETYAELARPEEVNPALQRCKFNGSESLVTEKRWSAVVSFLNFSQCGRGRAHRHVFDRSSPLSFVETSRGRDTCGAQGPDRHHAILNMAKLTN